MSLSPQTARRWNCPAVSTEAALVLRSETSGALRGAESSLSEQPSPASALQGPVTHNGRWDKHKDSLVLFSSCKCAVT